MVPSWRHCVVSYTLVIYESRHTECGDRFFADAPGIYMHRDSLRGKAESYCRFVQLDPRVGLFYAAMWELLAHRDFKVTPRRHTDQWVQQPAGVRLAALWVCVRAVSDIEAGMPYAWLWDPEMEANPVSAFWTTRAATHPVALPLPACPSAPSCFVVVPVLLLLIYTQ